MKRVLQAVAVSALLVTAQAALATPSTVFWTPATTYTQPFMIPHLTYDSYVAEKGALQNDYGLTLGVIPSDKIQGEVGFDAFLPTPAHGVFDFFQLNAKLTLVEGAFGAWQPGVSAGIMNVGFKKDLSDYNLLHAEVGKTFKFGTFTVGGYYGAGSKTLWLGSDGKEHRWGGMGSYVSPDFVVDLPGLQKIVFVADAASGKNFMGAIAPGLQFNFTPAIDLITGPVFFLDRDLYKGNSSIGTDMLWSFQIDVDFDLIKKPAAPAKS